MVGPGTSRKGCGRGEGGTNRYFPGQIYPGGGEVRQVEGASGRDRFADKTGQVGQAEALVVRISGILNSPSP